MQPCRIVRAFTLLEVILAVGLFVSAVSVSLGLMAGLSRISADARDELTAQRLPEPLKVELTRLAAAGFDRLADRVPVLASPLPGGLRFAADRDAVRLDSLDYMPVANGVLDAGQYYLVECWRFPSGPLSFDGQKAFLALHVRVSWPYRVAGATAPTPLADRSQLAFTQALNR